MTRRIKTIHDGSGSNINGVLVEEEGEGFTPVGGLGH